MYRIVSRNDFKNSGTTLHNTIVFIQLFIFSLQKEVNGLMEQLTEKNRKEGELKSTLVVWHYFHAHVVVFYSNQHLLELLFYYRNTGT